MVTYTKADSWGGGVNASTDPPENALTATCRPNDERSVNVTCVGENAEYSNTMKQLHGLGVL